MRLLLFLPLLVVVGCSGAGNLNTTMGSVERTDTFEMTAAYEAYYMTVMEQLKPVELVRIELDSEGRVASFTVNQAAPFQEIQVPKKSYSPGWTTANKFVDGLWSVAKFAVPGATAWATADAIGKIADRPNISDSYNTQGDSDSSIADSYSPIDNSNQNNPVDNADNSNQNNPIDNSNQDNPIDNSNQNNPLTNEIIEGEEI